MTRIELSGDIVTLVSPLASAAALQRHALAVAHALAARNQRTRALGDAFELAGLVTLAATHPIAAAPALLHMLDALVMRARAEGDTR